MTRISAPSARTGTDRSISENSLPPKQIQEDTADVSRKGSSSHDGDTENFVSYKWGRYEPRVEKPKEPDIVSGKRVSIQRNLANRLNSLGRRKYAAKSAAKSAEDDGDEEDDDFTSGAAQGGEAAPESFNEAVQDPRWCESMQTEIRALKNRGVWRVIPTPKGVRLIKSKYVYRVKKDWTGKVVKRKSRLVVQGFHQREGIDYDETFAPVAKVTTFRLMLALSKVLNLEIHQLDVDSAFLYVDLDEDVYVKPPQGMSIRDGYILKLLKSLYGLKQAPRNWNKTLWITSSRWGSNSVFSTIVYSSRQREKKHTSFHCMLMIS